MFSPLGAAGPAAGKNSIALRARAGDGRKGCRGRRFVSTRRASNDDCTTARVDCCVSESTRVAFWIEGLVLDGCKRLQNAGEKIVRLTSPDKSPYFPKLDSSFCQAETHDRITHGAFFFWYRICECTRMSGFVCDSTRVTNVTSHRVTRQREAWSPGFDRTVFWEYGSGVFECGVLITHGIEHLVFFLKIWGDLAG